MHLPFQKFVRKSNSPPPQLMFNTYIESKQIEVILNFFVTSENLKSFRDSYFWPRSVNFVNSFWIHPVTAVPYKFCFYKSKPEVIYYRLSGMRSNVTSCSTPFPPSTRLSSMPRRLTRYLVLISDHLRKLVKETIQSKNLFVSKGAAILPLWEPPFFLLVVFLGWYMWQ